jgi:DNA-binding MarR family transcriptional regulator
MWGDAAGSYYTTLLRISCALISVRERFPLSKPPYMARIIRLNGREAALLRTIGFGLGVNGSELQERLQMASEDLVDVINTLLDLGYVETASAKEKITPEEFLTESFEINPSYAADLKSVLRRGA